MSWNWFTTLFRPLGAARHIASLQEEIDSWRLRVEKADKTIVRLETSVMTSREMELMQRTVIKSLENELTELKTQLTEAQADQADFEELEALISQFEMQKEKYEKRIKSLRAQLKDAREAIKLLRPKDIDEMPESVDMSDFMRNDSTNNADPDSQSDLESPDDWLLPLPDSI